VERGRWNRAQASKVFSAVLAVTVLSSCVGSATQPPTSSTGLSPSASTSASIQTTTTSAVTSTTAAADELPPLFEYLKGLTSIRPYDGWRNSATTGEAEALDFVADVLGGFSYLQALGLELERQSFPVFAATELRESRLYLTSDGQETEVAADAPRGHRHDLAQALRFDSDGALNDSEPNPAVAEGEVVVIRSQGEIAQLGDADLQGAIVFVDYEMINPASRSAEEGAATLARLIDGGAAGLVLVTDATAGPEAQPGKLAGDGKVLEAVTTESVPPALNVRLEDCAAVGITGWDDLTEIDSARLVWDADVFSPGTSGNLIARIPGADPSRAVILGAHIDGPNTPAALDNGANSAVLLEVARVLDERQEQPPVDLYLVWFGSEELWLYGSLCFVDTHQELLDRAVGALLMDAFIAVTPDGYLSLDGWSHSRFGSYEVTFARYLEQLAAAHGITVDEVTDIPSISSDNSVFSAFVPQAGLGFGGYTSGYAHTPYDTWEAAAAQADLIGQVADVALLAALETGRDLPDLRVTPEPDRRALVVGSHTQVAHISGATLVTLAQALAWEGFDVDTIPYGRAVTREDLESASLVVVLPVMDYSSQDVEGAGDEAWAAEEVDALVDYVERGGLLVLVNSARRVVFGRVFDPNEDWDGANALAERFGVTFTAGAWSAAAALIEGEHLLTQDTAGLIMIPGNGVHFTMTDGQVLAKADGQPAAGLIDYGTAGGQVLVLADVGMLGLAQLVAPETDNLGFLRHLAAYARNH
jgi:Zn-dependent M28 family amino/carboxypeptidase